MKEQLLGALRLGNKSESEISQLVDSLVEENPTREPAKSPLVAGVCACVCVCRGVGVGVGVGVRMRAHVRTCMRACVCSRARFPWVSNVAPGQRHLVGNTENVTSQLSCVQY